MTTCPGQVRPAGAFHFQQDRGPRYNAQRRLLSKGASGAPVRAFTQCKPPALLIRRFNRSATKSALRSQLSCKNVPAFQVLRAPAVTTQLSRGSFSAAAGAPIREGFQSRERSGDAPAMVAAPPAL